jgi:uncharacterized protein (DUF433 family)
MIQETLSRISIRPDVCFGKPCIRGHRIWVSLILDRLATGETIDELLQDYPGIEKEDILACIAYGAEMSRDLFADIPLEIYAQTEGVLE